MPIQSAGWLRPPLPGSSADGQPSGSGDAGSHDDARSRAAREEMVALQVEARGVRDPSVLAAMRQVPRHLFVPPELRAGAYADHPLPIGHGQTISQPYIVALMTELARPTPADRALEVGTGSGYQAAVLSRIVRHVFSLEIDDDLSRSARDRLAALGYANVTTVRADGHAGLAEEAPFEVILVTAAPSEVPQALVDQLTPGGRLVIPVGLHWAHDLCLVEKRADGVTTTERILPVVFVPMVHAGESAPTPATGTDAQGSKDGKRDRN
jgi:protein-L-isoaspartate(D-aspartate) O-methyltransferase